ncbi:MAG: SagB/ThcOx family dehydrogenase [Methanoregula sp.]|jgi:SagB-type dehydrogenase family enzyme|uniref:SagB/ThcOx family dehydrogenase n=1 Tax=Methanoregula sp. TaxID=2052170 RepID=UPI003C205FC7
MNDIGNAFIKGTRYPDFSTVDLVLRVPEPPHELPVREGQTIIKLPSPKRFKVPDVPVRKAIESWEPVGFFSRSSLNLKELSYLLWCMQGFRKIVAETFQLRNVPSSGARYPLETYFVASDVEGLETGLYRYLPKSNSIVTERLDSDLTLEMSTASLNFKLMTRAAITFLWVAVPYRSVWALGNRGYRSVLIEAGHTCQNLILAAANLGYAVFPTDMFHDDLMVKLANLDPETQWPVYLAAVGKAGENVTLA